MDARTILVPLNGSELASGALPHAKALARATGGGLRLVSVVEMETGGLFDRPREVRGHLERLAQETLEAYLGSMALHLRDEGFEVSTALTSGDPAEEILVAADEPDVAMIVMATHGRRGLDRWLIGSVADKVMRTSTRPTLLVRPVQAGAASRIAALTPILVPLDGSKLAETALPFAVTLARALDARLILARVEPLYEMAAIMQTHAPDNDRPDQTLETECKAYLAEVRQRCPRDLDVKTVVLVGSVASCLIGLAEGENAGLVVMTTHGRGGVRRAVLGSTADRLARAGLPVLLLRGRTGVPSEATGLPGVAVRRCASCGRFIPFAVEAGDKCPRCQAHLHACGNCVFWDTTACVIQRPEAHDSAWRGRDCPQFIFRKSVTDRPAPTGAAKP